MVGVKADPGRQWMARMVEIFLGTTKGCLTGTTHLMFLFDVFFGFAVRNASPAIKRHKSGRWAKTFHVGAADLTDGAWFDARLSHNASSRHPFASPACHTQRLGGEDMVVVRSCALIPTDA